MCPFCVPIYKKKDSVLEFQIRFVTIFFLYTIRIFMTYALIAVDRPVAKMIVANIVLPGLMRSGCRLSLI